MTLAEIRLRVWSALGEPENLNPGTDDQYNGGPLLTWVANEGQRQVAKWKDKQTNKPVLISDLYAGLNFSTFFTLEVIAAVNNTTTPYSVTLTSSLPTDDVFNDWIVEGYNGTAIGEKRIVTDYTGTTRIIYLSDAFITTPTIGDVVWLYKRFEKLLPATSADAAYHIALPTASDSAQNVGNLLQVLSIVDLIDKAEVTPAPRVEKYSAALTDDGVPSTWYMYGNRIYFDVGVKTYRTYHMEYYRTPTDMVADGDLPDIPEIYHWAICLWGMWWGYKDMLESSMAYSTKLDFEDEMRRTTGQNEIRKERLDMKVRHDDLVAGINNGPHGQVERLADADGYQYLAVRVVLHPVLFLEIAGGLLAQLRYAGVGGIHRVALFQGLHCGLADVPRRGVVRLADAERDNAIHRGKQVEELAYPAGGKAVGPLRDDTRFGVALWLVLRVYRHSFSSRPPAKV